ncbi:MAG: hypothetical protein HY040_20270 [Planctomycetes bacterium]|nr:hypothetical protein [Planctomycetota bacterium]
MSLSDLPGTPFHPVRLHPPKRPTERSAIPPGIAMILWSFGCLSLGLICWGAYQARIPQPEKNLQSLAASHKFKAASAEEPELIAPPSPEPIELVQNEITTPEPPLLPALVEPPSVEPPVVEPPVPLPPVVTPPVGKVELPKVELPPVMELPSPPQLLEPPAVAPTFPDHVQPVEVRNVEVRDDTPLVYLPSNSGETPMLSNWKTLAVCSLLAATPFVAPPAVLAGGEKDKVLEKLENLDKGLAKAFEGIARDMDDIKTQMKKLREKDLIDHRLDVARDVEAKMNVVSKGLTELRTAFDLLKARIPVEFPAGADKTAMEDIRTKLAAIEQALGKLAPTEKRVALASPQIGRVVLVNLYPEELLFVVNQKTYRVGPNMTAAVDNLPTGALTYEVVSPTWGLRARNTTNLAANETFTLTAR